MAVNTYTVLHIISRNCYNLIPKEGDVVLTTLASDCNEMILIPEGRIIAV